MTNAAVKDAKNIYIDTGRLNRNIISKEISISWYKCKLQNLNPKEAIRQLGEKPSLNFESKFLTYIDSIVPLIYDYIMVNMSLQKCSSRMQHTHFEEMDTIDDLAIGTNGGYLTYKTQSNQLVSLDEHYLECMSDYYSYGIMISQGDKMLGVLMLLSKEKPNEYDVVKIREKLIQFNVKSEVVTSNTDLIDASIHRFRQFFAYPEPYLTEFELTINKTRENALPLLICGSKGSGKSTLARILAESKRKIPFVVSLNETPRTMQKNYIEYGLSQFETVVIESLEDADIDVLSLLTVYTEELLLGKTRDKNSVYKCSNLIVTTVYNSENTEKILLPKQHEKQIKKFTNKLKLNTVNLLNTDKFADQIDTLVEAILMRNGVLTTDAYKIKLSDYLREHSFKSVQQMIEISMEDTQLDDNKLLSDFPILITQTILNLEEHEKDYILKIYELLDKNMMSTASILKIGRSTLYRKLEKYQNETLKSQKTK